MLTILSFLSGENNLKVIFYILLTLFFLKFPLLASENECQGAKLRIINKITAEKVFYDVPLSQTLELDNAKIIIFRCMNNLVDILVSTSEWISSLLFSLLLSC